VRETDGVMAEAALKERLPPLLKDTLDWRDMMACSWWSKSTGRLVGWEVLETTELSRTQWVALLPRCCNALFYPLRTGLGGRVVEL
jgi:hypothetical protein